jgi:hypothetical protein
MEYFLGGLVKSVGRAVGKAAKTVGRIPIVRDVGRAASRVGRVVESAAKTVGRIPVLGDIARAGLGAARLSLGPAALAIDTAQRVARGENLGKALRGAVSSHVDAVRDQLKLAEMVAPFIPGIGTGVAAALGAANALASGRPITEALISAARSALPGGGRRAGRVRYGGQSGARQEYWRGAARGRAQSFARRAGRARCLRRRFSPGTRQEAAGRCVRRCGSHSAPVPLRRRCPRLRQAGRKRPEHSARGIIGRRSTRHPADREPGRNCSTRVGTGSRARGRGWGPVATASRLAGGSATASHLAGS